MSYGYSIARHGRVARFLAVIVVLLMIMFSFSACGDEKKTQAEPQVGEMSKYTFPNIHKFGQNQVFYTAEISEATAVSLGEYLMDHGWDKGAPWGGRLAKKGDIYELHVILNKELIEDPKVQSDTRDMARLLSKKVFGDAVVEIHLCGERYTLLKLISSGEPTQSNKK
ncbi:MAG: hypothetical protein GY841_05745 [FCB group bacterium]|nr:hypothetical protein [FCB group bacterium]